MWSSRFPIVSFTLFRALSSSCGPDTVITCNKSALDLQTLSNTSHSSAGWLSKTLLGEHDQHFKQCCWRKKSVNKSKLFLNCFTSNFFLHINQVRLLWQFPTLGRGELLLNSPNKQHHFIKKTTNPHWLGTPPNCLSPSAFTCAACSASPIQTQVPSSFTHSLHQARLLPGLRPHSLGLHSFSTLNRVCLQKPQALPKFHHCQITGLKPYLD